MFRNIEKICNRNPFYIFHENVRRTFLQKFSGFSRNQLFIKEIGEKLSIFVNKYLKKLISKKL
ncbi:hypothetical protein QE441_001368 [Chryseobacterium sp. SORGH_AS909]|uniref:Uncharacterized protein n=1 Tax=Chryseobacterium camelliae TaxID=1265445 RepID=A0ABU0TMC9_9FLAO|nr:hypothetical protein [Chryseobacterium camelliae]MDQ1102135.1 hypothetical protein [Chryseobacterium sp. SORGH_AS_1048]MDR6085574.1 hypothetical protein [Chryseobacterium sp. SORGH_AS_0909]MDR6129935.1 hypothetical protein [Chryseobacterium sp. SORGH_AS_1175]MDT3407935.1 hypothetical protein [Pseudacidovorax intermedius]